MTLNTCDVTEYETAATKRVLERYSGRVMNINLHTCVHLLKKHYKAIKIFEMVLVRGYNALRQM